MSLHAPYVYRLATELHDKLKGMSIKSLYSLDKKQLYFQFEGEGEKQFHLVFRIDNSGCYFSFPDILSSSVSNRQDRFQALFGQRVLAVTGHPAERSFHIELENAKLILFCHGRNAQVFVMSNGMLESFRQQDKTDISEEENKLKAISEGKWPLSKEAQAGFMNSLLNQESEAFKGSWDQWLKAYFKGPVFLNKAEDGSFYLSPWEGNASLEKYTEFIEALDQSGRLSMARFNFLAKKAQLVQQYARESKSLEARLKALLIERKKLEDTKNYRHLGDLILANLFRIKTGDSSVLADDYLSGGQTEIKLQTGLSPQDNAQRYYRKAKNQHREVQKIDTSESELQEKWLDVEEIREELEQAMDMKALRPFLKEEKLKEKKQGRLPYHSFVYLGFTILVGKQAVDNDTLTLKLAKKDDLWLHARDVAGSHVVVRKKAGIPFPDKVIDYACGLALWFSKRKNESLAPVTVSEKKYVRKRKGDPPGAVVVERETVRLAAPIKPDSQEI